MKAICALMLLLCICKAFGEGPANDDFANVEGMFQPEEQMQENDFDESLNGQEVNEADNLNEQNNVDELASDNIEDNKQETDDNVSKESLVQIMGKTFDETGTEMQGGSKPVCYLRTCKWVVHKVKQYYPVDTKENYTHSYPVTIKVPGKTQYVCGQTPYTVSKPYHIKVPVRKNTCHVYGGHKYCSPKSIYTWTIKYRTLTLYRPKICSKSIFNVKCVYKTRTLPGVKHIFKYRTVTIKRNLCTYKMGGYYNGGY